ncbi:F-box/WD repeat-containing protein 5-like [Gordionus sp. m RMFG-2023]|uniref:F-box/WD repeat-containing protein 5-like n=1 Tax=Gordionus sp. m RMFG-2023 TaxID=3053472 RepID=UPI0031FC01DA
MDQEETYSILPDNILLTIFSLLDFNDVVSCELACINWRAISHNNHLWKLLFHKHYKLIKKGYFLKIKLGALSWREEFIRLYYEVPLIQLKDPYVNDKENNKYLLKHKDQVLHVNFSHDGKMFATCSKDGFIKVWNMSSFPIITLKYSFDLKLYNWKYTQYSCFNADDTLLLVSGVHFGSHSTSGEIAVFNVIDGQFTLQCRVINRPYDVFGTWYNEDYLISGNLHWFGHLLSCSSLWINKAWQETDSELETVVMRTFKFFNVNGSSVRNIMVCDCLTSLPTKENQINVDSDAQLSETDANHNYQIDNRIKTNEQNEIPPWASTSVDLPTSSSGSSTSSTSTLSSANLKDPRNSKRSLNDSRKHALNGDKYLVFTTGSKTYVPHQIGFKLIKPIKLPTISQALAILNPSSSAHRDNRDYPETVGLETDADTIHDYNPLIYRGARSFPNNEFQNYPEQMDFDSIDHLIDFNGHIIGMTFSPDQK